jgi:signal transduction histidine kinase
VADITPFHLRPRDPQPPADVLAEPSTTSHAVVFYEDPSTLFESVAAFFKGGLDADERVVAITTAAHRGGITSRLGLATMAHATATGQLVWLDAHETLERFMNGSEVDVDRFRELIGGIVRDLRAKAPGARIRAFGEMVDVLWRAGSSNAALRLEDLWNDVSQQHSFGLLCAYGMGCFDGASYAQICAKHSHVFPSSTKGDGHTPAEGALEDRVRTLEVELHHRKGLEIALREALRDRSRVERELRESISREREARSKAEENDHFKEKFLAVLGHDLRNPLNTILTTTRLMLMRAELPEESAKRLERVVSSGVRMQRMIEQILDATCDHLEGCVRIVRDPAEDLTTIVAKVVDAARLAHPARKLQLFTGGVCRTSVDRERIVQVLRTLVGNALTHGTPEQPVRVCVIEHDGTIHIEVQNGGPAIEDDVRMFLFDPLRRSRKTMGSEGLGLGLYIAQRIVAAHGGELDVESSAEAGTRFRVVLPRFS